MTCAGALNARLSPSADKHVQAAPADQAVPTANNGGMNRKISPWLISLAAAVTLAAAGALQVAHAGIGKDAVKTAQQRIATQAEADAKACRRLQGTARDVCVLQAKAREKIARAELEARVKPGPQAEQQVKEIRADAEYAIARKRCENVTGQAADRCVGQAKAVREAAVRQAKVEKVEKLNELKAAAEEPRQERHAQTLAERYKAEKARCGMMGTERDRCMADLQRRYPKS